MKLSDLGGDSGGKPMKLSDLPTAPSPAPAPPPTPVLAPPGPNPIDDFMAPIKAAGHEVMEDVRRGRGRSYFPGSPVDTSIPDLVSAALSPVAGVINVAEAPVSRAVAGTKVPIYSKFDPLHPLSQHELKTPQERTEAVSDAIDTALAGMMDAPRELRARTPPTPHQERIARLQERGVELTPGQIEGGRLKRREDVHATSPYVGEAIQKARRNSVDSFQRATYDHVLQALGKNERYAGPVGHEGMQHLYAEVDAAYGRALLDPNAKAVKDGNWLADLGTLRAKVPKSMRDSFDHKVSQLWVDSTGTLNGRQFKARESDLRKAARAYQTSSVASEQELGGYLSEAAKLFRDSAERNSPPGTRAALRKADEAYALLRRVEGAAGRRTTLAGGRGVAEGRFAPGDLLQAIKQQDDGLHKRAFIKGDALLQRFAEDAQAVLPSEVADSGSPERLKTGVAGRLGGTVLGAALGQHLGGLGAEIGAAGGLMAGEPLDRMIATLTNARKSRQMAETAKRMVSPKHSALRQALRDPRIIPPIVAGSTATDGTR